MDMRETGKKTNRVLLIETNRRLQEASQKLFMAKQELEKRNEELEKARQNEHEEINQLQNELNSLKRLAYLPEVPASREAKGKSESTIKNKLTIRIVEDLLLRYVHLLKLYQKTKEMDNNEFLIKELCLKLMEYRVTPKGLIGIHLKGIKQINAIGSLETKRVTYELRMMLLKVMTEYASLLLEKLEV